MLLSRTLLVGASLIAMASSAYAADLIIDEAPAPIVSAAAYDWTGVYVGASAGFATGTVDWTGDYYDASDVLLGGEEGEFDVSGWTLGVNAGANVQFDSFVLGVEGDISWANISGEGDPIDPMAVDPSVPSTQLDWIGSIRARAGIAIDQVLLYGTAGFAFAGGTLDITNLDGAGDDRSADITATGWTAGLGAEVAVTENVSIKGEYLYTALTADEVEFGDVLPADYLAVNSDFASHSFKVGVNFGF
jgi:outer membrane immunogenic protein